MRDKAGESRKTMQTCTTTQKQVEMQMQGAAVGADARQPRHCTTLLTCLLEIR